ncbi:MAG: hypothetical protein ACK5PP_18630 [Acidimicrobiales bacterium]
MKTTAVSGWWPPRAAIRAAVARTVVVAGICLLMADSGPRAEADRRRNERFVPPLVASAEPAPAGPVAVRPGPTVRVDRVTSGHDPTGPDPAVRADRTMSSVGYDWRPVLRDWELVFSEAAGPLGVTRPNDRRIELALPPDLADRVVTHALAHELGHALDVELLDPDDRAAWLTARGLPGPWWPTEDVGRPAHGAPVGAEDFAEAFAVWQLGPDDGLARLAAPLTGDQLALLADLLTPPPSAAGPAFP